MTVGVYKSASTLLPWSMYEVEIGWTFAKLVEVVRAAEDEPKCYLSQEIKHCASNRVQVMMSFNVVECYRINGNFISYVFSTPREIATPKRNAASVLMQSAREMK